MTAKPRLEADRAELARFVDATFRYADDATEAALRTFAEGSNEVLGSVRVPLNGAGLDPLVEHAAHQATRAANSTRPAVFAPPVATFVGTRTRERDLGNGLVLTVEADHAPAVARRNLQFVLGPPTVVVASGGQWIDPQTGVIEDKLHLHWRCREPSRSGPDHAELKRARGLGCAFVGADATAVSIVHPLRWPGSWHRKREPRLARILDLRPEVEIDPTEAIELLEPLLPPRRKSGRSRVGAALAEHTRDAERILAVQTVREPFGGVYARGSMLVRPVRLRDGRDTGGIRRAAGSLVLLPADENFLRLELTRLVHLERFDKRSEEWVDVDAPAGLARSLLAAVPWETLPPLTGIVETPTLRGDGTLLDNPGYDEQTGLLFDPGSVVFPSIPPRPTRTQAETARDLLLEVLEGFPFADEASRSVAVAAFITGLVRRSLRSAPLFAFSAPKMASGKTLLASCVGYIATGRAPAMMTQGDDSESERKRLFALLLEGVPIIVIDNLERPLASDALCSILTSPCSATACSACRARRACRPTRCSSRPGTTSFWKAT